MIDLFDLRKDFTQVLTVRGCANEGEFAQVHDNMVIILNEEKAKIEKLK